MDTNPIKTAFFKFARHCLLWILIPNLLFYALTWWLSRPKPRAEKARVKKEASGQVSPFVASKPDSPLWSEIKYQTSRTDFLASCSVATLDDLRYRKDRVLAMQAFMRKPQNAKKVSAQALESINERLDLQLCAVDNWMNLKLQERARPVLDARAKNEFDLFCKFVRFREATRR